MDHSYYKDKISAFSDGALEAQERELIKRHLEECAECRMILEQLNNFNRTIEEKSKLAGDEYFEKLAQKIEHRIAAPKEKAVDIREVRWKSFWWKVSAAAASILLVAVVVNYQLKEDSGRPSRMLQDMDRNEAPAAVSVDSTVVSENFENGRIDQTNEVVGNEIAGQTVDTEEATKKKVSAGKPDGQEKDERHMAASKELEGALK
ncbi:MAG: anti-sigma factor family protein, partial [Candidatus Zixiibacteriota bacterium]